MDDLTKNIGFIVYPKLGIPSPPSSAMEIPKADIPDRYKMLGIKQPKVKHFGAVHSYVNKDYDKPLDEHKQMLTGFATSDKSPNSMLGNRGHETQHMVFSKIKATHGKNFGDKLVAHTLSVLSPIDRKIIEHINPERNKYSEENRAEELLSNFHNYLQDPKHRDIVHKKLGLSPNGARTLHNKAKSVWKALRNHAATIDFQTINKSERDIQKTLDYTKEPTSIKIPLSNIFLLNRWGHPISPDRRDYHLQPGANSPPIKVELSGRGELGEYVHSMDPQSEENGEYIPFDHTPHVNPNLPNFYLSDGHHRVRAAQARGDTHINAVVHTPETPWYLKGSKKDQFEANLNNEKAKLSLGFGKNEDPQKRTPPVFPKLGVPDKRNQVEYINDPKQAYTKLRTMAHAGAQKYTKQLGLSDEPAAKDRKSAIHSDAASQAREAHYGIKYNTTGTMGQVQGPNLGYALSGILRPSGWGQMGEDHETHSQGTKNHEEFHHQMGRIEEKHGEQSRRNLAENLFNALPDEQRHAVNYLQDYLARDSYKGSLHQTEEKIARIFNYLNSPGTRKQLADLKSVQFGFVDSAGNVHDLPKGQHWIPGINRLVPDQEFDGMIKQAHRNLLAAGEVADANWLRPGHVSSSVFYAKEQIAKSESIEHQLGHHNHLETLCVAARFLSGKQTDDKKLRDALRQSDGDLDIGVLIAHDLLPTKENIKALHSVTKIQDLNKATLSSDKYKVEAALPEAEHVTDKLQEAINLGHVQPVKLGGKHSEGTLLVQCGHESFLIKPESKVKSPAAGINEEPATQSEREVAFYKIAESVGLGHIIPHSELITLNGKQAAAMAKLPFDWRNLDSAKREDPNIARTALEPYRESGELFKWAILDAVLSNVDRHANNLMVSSQDDGYKIALIDHGSAFAGEGFNPTDTETFVPFYLRAWSNRKWPEMTDAEKLKAMPRAPAEKEKEVFHWLLGINQDKIATIMQRYGINAQPHIAILNRLKNSKTAIDQAICQFWLGLFR